MRAIDLDSLESRRCPRHDAHFAPADTERGSN
jgi:hypothetical protein